MRAQASIVYRSLSLFVASIMFAAMFLPTSALGQGFLLDLTYPRPLPRWIPSSRPAPPESTYRIESLEVGATLGNSVAKVDISQTFKNEGSTNLETSFVFPLPYDGAIDSMTLLVDGKEYPAKLCDAKEARSTYESIVRKNKDPALLEWIGSGMFKTSVFPIPAGETRVVTISYTQHLRTSDGLTEFLFPLSCAKYSSKPISKISFDLTISGDSELKNAYSPTYDVNVERVGNKAANVKYTMENKIPANDFRLFFDQSSEDLTAKIQSYRPNDEDGYFLLLAAPKIVAEKDEKLAKTIVFALDVSGSMSGAKIEQARDSLKFVLERLHDGDKFNIVLFNSQATAYKTELQTSSEETRAEAIAFVNSVRARGGTNIQDALESTFAYFNSDETDNPKYCVFLSDGEPTARETNEMKLAQIARTSNTKKARVFTVGVGFDVNSRLLDRFVRDGRGLGEYVKPNENIESFVSQLYSHIESPVYSDVSFDVALKNDDKQKYITNLVYPSEKIDVFSGEQIVLVGRYSQPGVVAVHAKGKVGSQDVEFVFDGELTAHSADASHAFIERLWTARRVGEIVDELDLNGNNDELMKELLELSKKHGILTPYTSFLADESVALNAASNVGRTTSNFNSLAMNTSNASGFAQRGLKQSYRNARTLDSASADSVQAEVELAATASPDVNGGFGGGMGALITSGIVASGLSAAKLSEPRMARAPMGAAKSLDAQARDVAREPASKIKTVAGKTFYFKEERWIDATIDENMEKNETPVKLEQFSDKYFELVSEFGQEFSQYLVFTESVLLEFKGKVYRIDVQP